MATSTVPVEGLSAECPLCAATRYVAENGEPLLDEVVTCERCGSRYTYRFLLHRNPPGKHSTRPRVDELLEEVAKVAYFRAQNRGFAPGQEEQDWLKAEASVLSRAQPARD
jgi:hypothetical protein